VAVEPSEGMRRQAADKRTHPRVSYIGGDAVRIPLRNGSCSHAWVSTVIHHIPDLSRCARELRRVLLPGDRVLIRNAFSGRMDSIMWARFFPSARRLADENGPTVEGTVKAFSVAGFQGKSLARCPRCRHRICTPTATRSAPERIRG
jgi:ubiquinone/menaquinone biosynthesis C-methylase UbiE